MGRPLWRMLQEIIRNSGSFILLAHDFHSQGHSWSNTTTRAAVMSVIQGTERKKQDERRMYLPAVLTLFPENDTKLFYSNASIIMSLLNT